MSQSDLVFAGSIPALYERYLGPLIFEPYAPLLAVRVANANPGRVLETAAGTGILTRALARLLPETTAIVATDLNQPMLDFAAAQSGAGRVSWRSADALALPFFEKSFDVVVCQFGAMFFPDKVAAYREALRVLRPGGCLVLGVWDRIEENEFAEIVTESVAALFPGDPPGFLKRTPHGYHDATRIRGELESVGFASVTVETIARRSRAPGYRDPAIGYCQGTPLRNEIEARDASRLGEATEAAAAALGARFGFAAIDGKIQAHVITAAP
jgi:ubiquinone/menaquinone biosynthesis C-methylase UbiE